MFFYSHRDAFRGPAFLHPSTIQAVPRDGGSPLLLASLEW